MWVSIVKFAYRWGLFLLVLLRSCPLLGLQYLLQWLLLWNYQINYTRSSIGLVRCKHVSQNVFGVFQPLGHFYVSGLQCRCKRICGSDAFLVYVGHLSAFWAKNDLSMIFEIDLHYFIAESEHDSMLGSHPLFHIHLMGIFSLWRLWFFLFFCLFVLCIFLQIASKVLKESNFFLELFWVFSERMSSYYILLVCHSFLNVVKISVACY